LKLINKLSNLFLLVFFLFCFERNSFAFEKVEIPQNNHWQENLNANQDNFGFLAIGDMGTGWSTQYKLVDLMASNDIAKYSAVLLLGDISYPDGNPKLIEQNIHKPYQKLYTKEFKFYTILGNHDWHFENGKYIKEYFDVPEFYSFQIGSAEFFALNSAGQDGRTFDKKQAEWLEKKLQKSRASWKIVLLHHPPFSASKAHPSNKYLQETLVPLLDKYKVNLCLAGHNHFYERTEKIKNTVYITSGGGSASLYDLRENPDYPRAFAKKTYQYLRVTGNKKSLKLESIDSTGEIIDKITLFK